MSLQNTTPFSTSTPKLLLNFNQRMQNQNKQLSWPILLSLLLCGCLFHHRAAGTDSTCACQLLAHSQQRIFNPLQQGLKGKASHLKSHRWLCLILISNHTIAGLFTIGQAETEKHLSLPWFQSLGSGAWNLLWFAFHTEDHTLHWWLGKMHYNIGPDLQRRRKGKGGWSPLVQFRHTQHLRAWHK